MDSQPNEIDELLTGMLDGMLSEDEARRLDVAMKDDSGLHDRLEELAQLRTSILKGRTKARLSTDFSKIVTMRARERALEMGPEGPNWIVPSGLSTPVKIPAPVTQAGYLRPMIYASVLGAAAVFALVMMTQQPQDDRFGIIADRSNNQTQPGPLDEVPAAELLANDSITGKESDSAKDEIPLPERSNATSIAEVSSAEVSSAVASNAENLPGPKATDSNDKTIHESTMNTASAEPPNSSKAVTIEPKIAKTPEKKPSGAGRLETAVPSNAVFTLVFDITADPVAIESKALENILEKHGIVYADDLAISDDQLKSLEESQLVATEANQEKIGVLFLKAKTERLGLALVDILEQYRDFPDVRLNMGTHAASTKLLVKQLSNVKVPSGASDFVRPLSAARSFKAAKDSKSVSIRGDSFKTMDGLLPKDRQRISNALILVRPAK